MSLASCVVCGETAWSMSAVFVLSLVRKEVDQGSRNKQISSATITSFDLALPLLRPPDG